MQATNNHQSTVQSSSYQASLPENTEFATRLENYLHAVFEDSEILFPHEQAYILAAAAAALNEPRILSVIFKTGFAYKAAPQGFYEAVLQTYLFAGFPAALEGLNVLKTVCKEHAPDWKPTHAIPYNLSLFKERGELLCEAVYTTAFEKMRRNLIAISPDLAEWMILEGYGKALSRQGLEPPLRELAIVAVLAVLGWKTQLYSHLRGAMNLGAMPLSCMDTLKMLSIFQQTATPEMQPVLRSRLALAEETLTYLLGNSSTL